MDHFWITTLETPPSPLPSVWIKNDPDHLPHNPRPPPSPLLVAHSLKIGPLPQMVHLLPTMGYVPTLLLSVVESLRRWGVCSPFDSFLSLESRELVLWPFWVMPLFGRPKTVGVMLQL